MGHKTVEILHRSVSPKEEEPNIIIPLATMVSSSPFVLNIVNRPVSFMASHVSSNHHYDFVLIVFGTY